MPAINNQDLIKAWQTKAVDILWYMLKKWWFLILAATLGAAVGYFSVRNVKPTYTADISFVLSTEQRGGNALAGLAAQLGFDGMTSSPDNIFSGDNIIEFFKSRSLIGSALMSEVDSTSHQTLLNYIAQHQYNNIYKKTGPFNRDPKSYNHAQTNLYRNIIRYVGGSFKVFKKDKRLIFYIISTTSTDPNTAYYISKYMLDQTATYFIDTKTKVAATSLILLQHEADSLAMVLKNTYNSTAEMIDRTYNLNPSVSIQRSGSLFNQAKASAFASAYAEVMRNLEIAKINLQKDTPLYRIIDSPELPLNAVSFNKRRHIIFTSLIGFCLMFILLAAEYLYKNPIKINDIYRD